MAIPEVVSSSDVSADFPFHSRNRTLHSSATLPVTGNPLHLSHDYAREVLLMGSRLSSAAWERWHVWVTSICLQGWSATSIEAEFGRPMF